MAARTRQNPEWVKAGPTPLASPGLPGWPLLQGASGQFKARPGHLLTFALSPWTWAGWPRETRATVSDKVRPSPASPHRARDEVGPPRQEGSTEGHRGAPGTPPGRGGLISIKCHRSWSTGRGQQPGSGTGASRPCGRPESLRGGMRYRGESGETLSASLRSKSLGPSTGGSSGFRTQGTVCPSRTRGGLPSVSGPRSAPVHRVPTRHPQNCTFLPALARGRPFQT